MLLDYFCTNGFELSLQELWPLSPHSVNPSLPIFSETLQVGWCTLCELMRIRLEAWSEDGQVQGPAIHRKGNCSHQLMSTTQQDVISTTNPHRS